MGAVLSLVGTVLAFALADWTLDPDLGAPELSWLLPAFVVGYLRATGLENPERMRIINHLRILPGDHFRSIARTLGLGVGETQRHLEILLRNRIVRVQKANGKSRYYLCGNGSDRERNELFARHWDCRDLRHRVLNAVRNEGPVQPSTIAGRLGISRQLAAYHLASLEELGLVRKDGGRYRACDIRCPAPSPSGTW